MCNSHAQYARRISAPHCNSI